MIQPINKILGIIFQSHDAISHLLEIIIISTVSYNPSTKFGIIFQSHDAISHLLEIIIISTVWYNPSTKFGNNISKSWCYLAFVRDNNYLNRIIQPINKIWNNIQSCILWEIIIISPIWYNPLRIFGNNSSSHDLISYLLEIIIISPIWYNPLRIFWNNSSKSWCYLAFVRDNNYLNRMIQPINKILGIIFQSHDAISHLLEIIIISTIWYNSSTKFINWYFLPT